MRHRKRGRKFGRVRKVRRALYRSLLVSFISKEKIRTTLPKAKEIRPQIEKLVTKAKKGTLALRRDVIAAVGASSAAKLFSKIAPAYADRKGGYTRIIKLPRRHSDNAAMAILEFVK